MTSRTSRGLPGFLRRTLRDNFDDDDEGEKQVTASREADVSSSSTGDTASANGTKTDKATVSSSSSDGQSAKGDASASTSDIAPTLESETTNVKSAPVAIGGSGLAPALNRVKLEETQTAEDGSNPRKGHPLSKRSDSWLEKPSPAVPRLSATTAPRRKSYRDTQFERVITADVVNMAELRKLGWNGIPPIYRAQAWKIMLGYLPTNAGRRTQTLSRKRAEYRDAMAQHYHIDDDTRTLQEQETLRQVLVDVPRTAPEVPLFRNERIRRILTRLLYIWAMRHPASSYVQGINDLATPLLAVFLADYFEGQDTVLEGHVMNHLSEESLDELEADVYWCLTNLLAGIQDHYTSDQPGVQRMVLRLEELVQRVDGDLCRHFEETGIQFLQFSFKWMNCLLLREFQLKCVFRLWDTYISEKDGLEGFHVYVCAALLGHFSAKLQELAFDELFAFMQAMPTDDWGDAEIEVLLSQAFVLSTLFQGSDAHLTSGSNSHSNSGYG